jgi:hypothetical protein
VVDVRSGVIITAKLLLQGTCKMEIPVQMLDYQFVMCRGIATSVKSLRGLHYSVCHVTA